MAPSSEMPLPLGRTPSPIRSPPTESSADRTTTDVGITKDAELWFTDGNIVLLSSGTASCGQVAFRVYKGILSRASPVFQDLFEHAVAPPETVDPAPLAYVADEPEFVDGCPTVKVTDSSIEMRHFLRAIFQSGTTSLSLSYNKTRQPFAHLAAIARLAHKYQADALAAAAFERIEMFFTARQNPWSKLKSAYDYQEGLEIRGSQYALSLRPEDAVEAVNLARLFEKPLMLPLALYMCCVLDPQLMRNGIAREDGTLDRLSDDDFARCIGACLIMGLRVPQ
ncbi:hypothetical protein C2E23DRAFT_890983 [Lenzites betulinus]|nr:hypothetical protein C2E23DRAFT_890983 [Lenzites betulinus]